MTEHSHRQLVEGCFRCDLSREEAPIECEEKAPPTLQDDVARVRELAYRAGMAYSACVYRHNDHDRNVCPLVQDAARAMNEAYGDVVWRLIHERD